MTRQSSLRSSPRGRFIIPALALLAAALCPLAAVQAQTAATISASPATVTEGQPVTITVTLPGPWVGGLPGFSSGSQGVCNARRSQATLERCRDDGSATRDVVVFLTVTHNTSEGGDFNARPRSSVLIRRGQRTGTWVLHTLYDTDKDNETFTVSLASTQLTDFLNPITSGSPSSVQITITDDYPSGDGDLSKILIGNR